MTVRLTDTDEATVSDVVASLRVRLKLTPDGASYCKRFAAYLLACNGRVADLGDAKHGLPPRPKCSYPLTLGRHLRQETAAELAKALRDNGRDLKVPDGVLTARQGADVWPL